MNFSWRGSELRQGNRDENDHNLVQRFVNLSKNEKKKDNN